MLSIYLTVLSRWQVFWWQDQVDDLLKDLPEEEAPTQRRWRPFIILTNLIHTLVWVGTSGGGGELDIGKNLFPFKENEFIDTEFSITGTDTCDFSENKFYSPHPKYGEGNVFS